MVILSFGEALSVYLTIGEILDAAPPKNLRFLVRLSEREFEVQTMPKRQDQFCVTTRLEQKTLTKVSQLASEKKISQAQLIRDAVLEYLEKQEQAAEDIQESKLDARLKKLEDRLAAMLMRNSIDVGVIYNAIYYNMGANADKAFTAFYSQAVKRLQAKRKDGQDKAAMMKLVTDLYRKEEQAKNVADASNDSIEAQAS
jgi:hypothetical protein